MATVGELRSRILRLLDDPEGIGYADELLLQAINSALIAVLPWTPKTVKSTLTGNGTTTVFALPTDLYEIEAICVNVTGETLPRAVLEVGQVRGTRADVTNDWLEYPSGSITFSKALATSEIYDLYYLAYWPEIADFTSLGTSLATPEACITGLALYGAAYAILPAAVGAAEIRQFATRVDSGTPEHNPMQKTALYLLDLFNKEMNRHPKHQKAAR